MARNKLMLNNEWESVFNGLPDEQAGQLIKAVFAVHAGKATQISDPILSAIFGMMETVIMKNREAYEEKCKRNAENGSKGGRPKSDEKRTVTEKTETKRTVTTESERGAKKANRIEKNRIEVNIKEKESKERETRHKYGEYKHVLLTDEQYNGLVEKFGEEKAKSGIKRVDEYCEETGKTYKNYALVVQRWGVQSYKTERKNSFQNFPQRNDAEHAEMVAKIIAMQ